jgi:hypothetical protein
MLHRHSAWGWGGLHESAAALHIAASDESGVRRLWLGDGDDTGAGADAFAAVGNLSHTADHNHYRQPGGSHHLLQHRWKHAYSFLADLSRTVRDYPNDEGAGDCGGGRIYDERSSHRQTIPSSSRAGHPPPGGTGQERTCARMECTTLRVCGAAKISLNFSLNSLSELSEMVLFRDFITKG